MAKPANTARRTKRWKLTIGEDEYQGHTDSIDINTDTVEWTGGDDNTIVDDGDVNLTIGVAQDSANPDSLWRLMWDNPNTAATIEVQPHYDDETFMVSVDTTLKRPPLKTSRDNSIPVVQVQLKGTFTPPPETP